MNTGSRNIQVVTARAQSLANAAGRPYKIFYPATSAGRGPLFLEQIPSWHLDRQIEWAADERRQGNTVIFPDNTPPASCSSPSS